MHKNSTPVGGLQPCLN